MDLDLERKHLTETDRHIAAAKRRVEQQKKIIEKLAQGGHETKVAKSLLSVMERSLDAFEHHRKVIVETLETCALKLAAGRVPNRPHRWIRKESPDVCRALRAWEWKNRLEEPSL